MRLAVRPKPSCSSTSKCSITDTVCTPRSAIRVPWSLNRRNRSVKLSQKSWGGCPLQLCALNPVSSKAGELQWGHPFETPSQSDGCTLGAEEDHGHAASFSGRCPGRDPGWKNPRHPGRNAAAPLHRDLGRGGGGPCLRALVEPQATELVSHVPPGAARGDPGRWTRDPRPRHPYEERTPEGRRRPSLSGEIQDPGIDQIRP